MKHFAKKLLPYLPVFFQRFLYGLYEKTHSRKGQSSRTHRTRNVRPRILFYHLSALSFGGTEKFLQIIAKHLDKGKYDVYFMYSDKKDTGRKSYVEGSGITFIPFTFERQRVAYPFFLENMSPLLNDVVSENSIDLIVTAGSGYTEYPINTIFDIPIIMINIFGSPSVQKNIVKHVAISEEVRSKILPIVPKEKVEVMYIPLERPLESSATDGKLLRASLGLNNEDFIFGRIGRASDDTFDPIGIEAFKRVVKKFPHAHYLIQSPPPILRKKVKSEGIPHVHFLDPSSSEKDIWAFHHAIDALAHFRFDGESCGLNIIESMLAAKPIITHRSHLWNAHTEYLEPAFSRVAEKDDTSQYAHYMEEMIEAKNHGSLAQMGMAAQEKAERLFLIEQNIKVFEGWIDNVIKKDL